MLGDNSGKYLNHYVRSILLPVAADHIGQQQFGSGLNGAAFPHLYLRLCHGLAKHYSISFAVFFRGRHHGIRLLDETSPF